MKHKPRGFKRGAVRLDFDLYRVAVPIPGHPGAQLSVVDLQPEGVERTIVFVHGYAGVAETWDYQLDHFANSYRVIAPDLRGHGLSDAPDSAYIMPELVSDLVQIADVLKLPERFVLAGHSFGGAVCVEFAAAHPERVEKLILLSTAGEHPLPKLTGLVTHIPTALFRPFWRYRPRWNAEVHVMKRMMVNNLRIWNGWETMVRIKTPTLVITGERDRYFPRRVFDRVGQAIAGAEVVDVGASKHKVQLERHAAVNRAIERFLEDGLRRVSWREPVARDGQTTNRPWLASYEQYTPHSIPIPRRPLHQFLETTARWLPDRTATWFYGSSLSYRQLNARANQFAHALIKLGVQPGDRVMVVLPNMPQMIIAYYGILKAGAVVVMANPEATAPQIVRQIQRTEAKVLVTLAEFAELAGAAGRQLELVQTDIRQAVSARVYRQLMDRWHAAGVETGAARSGSAIQMERLTQDASDESPGVAVSPEDLAVVIFTSGTTDEPKGVRLSHFNLVANTMQIRHWVPDVQFGGETLLCVLPFTHGYGMTAAMNLPIALGATMVLLPVFELEQVLDHIKRYKPTLFPGVPTIYMALNNAPNVGSYGLSSIRACISGAAPLPVEVQEKFEKLTKGRLVEGYGLTETSPATHVNPFGSSRKPGSIGVPLPNTDAKILDLITGEVLPPGKVGELAVKGPQVMGGYWDGDDGSESSLKDGWLHTGDVAVMDRDGFFQIVSRKRDTIMAGEYSVFPRDVEEVLYENTKVMEVAVVGVTSAEGGQKVKAFVVPRPGANLSAEELLELCRKRLEPYAVPWQIEFRPELPKSFVGKVLRRMLIAESG